MNIYSVRFSPTGGTQTVADHLCSAFSSKSILIDLCNGEKDFSAVGLTQDDLCFVSVPSFGGRVPVLAAERLRRLAGNGALAVAVCTYGSRAYDDTLLELKDILIERGFRLIAAVAAVSPHSMFRPSAYPRGMLDAQHIQTLCRVALSRPDTEDRAQLRAFSSKIAEIVQSSAFGTDVKVPGAFPYRPIGAFVKPTASEERCTRCGICADMCPAGAIPADKPFVTDNEKCASCMRCTLLCARRARHIDSEVMESIEARLLPLLEGRKKNELFL